MTDQLPFTLIQGIIDLLIFSRVHYHPQISPVLSRAAQLLPLSKLTKSHLSDWFLALLGIPNHYFANDLFHQGVSQFTLTFRITEVNAMQLVHKQIWKIDIDNQSCQQGDTEEKCFNNVVSRYLKILQNLPLTTCLRKNRNFLKQYSIYYLISTSDKKEPLPLNTNRLSIEDCLWSFRVHLSLDLGCGVSRIERQEEIQKMNDIAADLKRKQSWSTMGSDCKLCVQGQQFSRQNYEYEMRFHFEQDEGGSECSQAVSIVLSSQQEYEVIEDQQLSRVKVFKQLLRGFEGVEQNSDMY